MATFVVAHGAWSSGWAWKKMRPLLRAAGHELFTPSYTGLGERVHLASPEITLSTHIQDVVNVLFFEDLTDVILVGHSYGGMVATGVADKASERIKKVVYLDAFVPRDGQSLNDLVRRPQVAATGGEEPPDGWLVPPMPASADASPEDLAWVTPRRVPQPRKTMEEKVKLTGAVDRLPRVYIYCLRIREGDVFGQFAARAKSEPGWTYEEIDATHSPNITAPDALAEILLRHAG
ncbi:MAG: alpha/beta fold hydrolase [Chloroflexota bacterium]